MQSTYNGTTNNFMNNTLIGGGAIPVPDARSPLGNNYNTTTNYSSMEKTHSPSPNPYDNTNTPLPLPGALNNFNNNTNTNNLYTPPVSAHERSTSPVIGLPNTTNNFSVPSTGYNSLDRYSSNTTYNNNNNTISVPNFAKDSPLGGDMTINNNNRDSYYNTDRNTYGSTIPVPLPSQNSPLKRENTFSRRDSLENRTGLDTTYSIGGNTNTYNTVNSLLPSNSLTTTTVPVPGVSSYNNNTSSYSTGLAPTTTGSYFANRLDTNNNSNAVSGVSPYANTSYMTGGTEVRKPRTWSSSSSD
ncbi:nucleoporin nup45 [Angomonas deanei]|uniref:Uncharacterized protein n=1 Tax=Angomonas deanei TaxID=59799 RepID=A0A7G2CLL3_9TRYP|nr:nucleoporin nup45 [Angomonas deanei]CAD2220309.1 hypothetical protein ADEAN_000782400 [Angomonas deanei]|eukprot:EPY18552.1 nucleoporin nup45 [Angomonas deanei]